MYNSEEPLRTAVFVFSMKNTKLLAMFDPSMLGEEKLVDNLKDIDRTRCVCVCVCVCDHTQHVCKSVCVRRCVHVHACMFVRVYVCIHNYDCTHTCLLSVTVPYPNKGTNSPHSGEAMSQEIRTDFR